MPAPALLDSQHGLERPRHRPGELDPRDVGNTSSGGEEEAPLEEQMSELVRRATTITLTGGHSKLLPKPEDENLDPKNPEFDAKRWAKEFYKTQTEALNGTPPNTAGLAFKNLNVFGEAATADYQKTVGNVFYEAAAVVRNLVSNKKPQRVDILQDLEGVMETGEMLCVLGPPGSGSSTFLKTIAGETYGFQVEKSSTLNYQGLTPEDIRTAFKGEAIYTAEVDHHFPTLTVGDTLYFAARARCPQTLAGHKHEYAEHLRDVVMAMLGITHTMNTRVGDDYIRGVSGGERKRVSIAEAALSYSPWQCWDNSTRGLDSANAIEFCRTLRLQSEVFGSSVCVAIYQAPQAAYEIFDKVIVLYHGRQIFFGRTPDAKAYFEGLGFECPHEQTTPDFLTSMTSPSERRVKPGWTGKTPPRSPDEFAQAWKESEHRRLLINDIEGFEAQYPLGGSQTEKFHITRAAHKSRFQRPSSPFTISLVDQFLINLWRAWRLLLSSPWMTFTMLATNLAEALIIGSIFYNLPMDSSSMFNRNLLIFYSILINALGSLLEIYTLYYKRSIVEKHTRYALYHPSMEALGSIVMDLPYKAVNAVAINAPVYFMCNLRLEPGPFFFFLMFSFTITVTMSMIFRFLGSVTKTVSASLAPSAIILFTLMIYSGFVIPQSYLDDWIGWLRWINPVFYTQESLSLNEFVGRQFLCVDFVPSGPSYSDDIPSDGRACAIEGAVSGEPYVDGGEHLQVAYGFDNSHRWRNFGIVIGLTFFFLAIHMLAIELLPSERSKGEILVYPRRVLKKQSRKSVNKNSTIDEEKPPFGSRSSWDVEVSRNNELHGIAKQASVFHWKDVCYAVPIKGETRTILDCVDGWVKPGTLTALMGVSGAGKTTLLDVLASRVTMGVISGQMLVDGKIRDSSFQRKTGYVTQQDLHLHTATVREALSFSALLRQPDRYTRQEKIDYVDEVLNLIDMESCADAVVGALGEGLNVEQRKRLTIGIELAARPELLLFFDEPTSGLDSQTSWAICDLMEKLTKSGQAILCTIHQPSAALFQRFDRLLLLAKGGRTVYFGDIGDQCSILIDYFRRSGAPEFDPEMNPAEYMLQVIGATPKSKSSIDWPQIWRSSSEYQSVQAELSRLSDGRDNAEDKPDPALQAEFAASFPSQLALVTKRVFQQYWRTPTYIWSKVVLTAGTALFVGLSQVNGDNTERGLFSIMLCMYIFLFIFSQIVEQAMPLFVSQRTLYEARERPAKVYSWVAFVLANILVELAWNSLMGIFSFIFWYYPMGLYRNAEWTDSVHSRSFATFMNVWGFFLFSSTFTAMIIAGIEAAEVAGGVLNLIFILMFAFAGVLAGPNELPGFWIFMYRVNPFTYVMESFLATALADAPVVCIDKELVKFEAPGGQTCGEYMQSFIEENGGYLVNNITSSCNYCTMSSTNDFLDEKNLKLENTWRNFGFIWAYCIFNVVAALALYWLMRVPKRKSS